MLRSAPAAKWLAAILVGYTLLASLTKRHYLRRFGWQ